MTSTTLTSSSTLSQRTSMSSFELTQEVLEAARDSLLEQETQIILAENISLEGFLKVFLDYIENEQDLPVKIRLVDAGGCEENLIVDRIAISLLMPLFDHGMFLILHLYELATHRVMNIQPWLWKSDLSNQSNNTRT
ncbi:hypothetical protein GLOIN_2v1500982 [Rhizophagus irregularis DAOM 181602=DAOM 197198]|nr:hypothetical protein GLOIN_2v1500982 [Rhizophagus irregularis DAOM 181602=DAOM 197198]